MDRFLDYTLDPKYFPEAEVYKFAEDLHQHGQVILTPSVLTLLTSLLSQHSLLLLTLLNPLLTLLTHTLRILPDTPRSFISPKHLTLFHTLTFLRGTGCWMTVEYRINNRREPILHMIWECLSTSSSPTLLDSPSSELSGQGYSLHSSRSSHSLHSSADYRVARFPESKCVRILAETHKRLP